MSVLGNRVVRTEDPGLLTGDTPFVSDIVDPLLDGAVHVTYVRSAMAHARIVGVDPSGALPAPGVVAVFTAGDLGLTPQPSPFSPPFMTCPLATDVVRYVGEPIAAVITERADQGEDAAELVVVDYEPLPVVVDPVEALESTTLLFPDVGTNVCVDSAHMGIPAESDDLFEGCEVVVSEWLVNQRLAPCPLEVRSGAAAWTADGKLVQWATSQIPHALHGVLSMVYAPAPVRVVTPAMGGGFGTKNGLHGEEILLGGLAAALQRPVRWTETRSESMQSLEHGRAQRHQVTIGGTRDGRVLAYRLNILQDAGAYPGFAAIIPVMMTRTMAPSVYDIAKVECTAKSVVTNTTPVAAYRGAGRPEAVAAIERSMDLFALETGIDPVEIRRKNLVAPFSQPFTTAMGAVYDVGDYVGALDAVLERAGYQELRAEQRRRRDRGDAVQMGIGVSCYVEITGQSLPGSDPQEVARVQIHGDGAATVFTGTSPHGQGHETSWAMIASSELGIEMDRIDVVHGDTDRVPVGGGTFGSRSLQQGGAAVQKVSIEVVDRARALAAELLEANVDDVVLDLTAGAFHVAGTPAVAKSWGELATAAAMQGRASLDVESNFVAPGPTFPFGAHLAVVEVDVETGKVVLTRFVACDDAGTVLNPLIFEGQVHGGIAQGVAQALVEEFAYDADGNPITGNLADYTFISAAELPNFEVVHMETPTPYNPLGAKGVGESGTVGSTPAVQSAVLDALSGYGVRHLDMPLTPERVWRAVATVAP
ncbi:MAG: aerobic carbon-monoxide dehydrogenase large subunit [Actinomycetota bacterium]|nr:aerobic carbon-monoxide dehydrogenase large subunit [Actinomycetota bacterium]